MQRRRKFSHERGRNSRKRIATYSQRARRPRVGIDADRKRTATRADFPDMTPYTASQIARAVRYIATNPAHLSAGTSAPDTARLRLMANRDWRMILTAALRECARPPHSWPDIGRIVGQSHMNAIADFERWNDLPWRERSNWLELIERTAYTQRGTTQCELDTGAPARA
jgi:hypothetical protein